MSFLKKLFNKEKKEVETIIMNEEYHTPVEMKNSYEEKGLTMPMSSEEEQLVQVIAASIFAENQLDTKLRVKSIVRIDPQKELVAVIAAAFAAELYPDSKFKVVKISEK